MFVKKKKKNFLHKLSDDTFLNNLILEYIKNQVQNNII